MAAKMAIVSALNHNEDINQVIIARDSIDIDDYNYFGEFNPVYLPTQNCMEIFYERHRLLEPDKNLFTIEKSLEIINCYVLRLHYLSEISENENILCLEPDTLVRGQVKFSSEIGLECLTVNKYDENLISFINNEADRIFPLEGWGFCVGMITRTAIDKIFKWTLKNQETLVELLQIDNRLENIDHGIPILAFLAGANVKKTRQITEVNRDRFWRLNRKVIVHQFKEYYE